MELESNGTEYGIGVGVAGGQGGVTTYPPFKRKAIRAAQVNTIGDQRYPVKYSMLTHWQLHRPVTHAELERQNVTKAVPAVASARRPPYPVSTERFPLQSWFLSMHLDPPGSC